MTTSLRRPVLSVDSFSISAIGLAPGLLGRGVVHAGREPGVDPVGDILDADQDIQLEIGRLRLFFVACGRRKPSR